MQKWWAAPQRGAWGQVGGPCRNVGGGLNGGRNFQKTCLFKDGIFSCLQL